MGVATGAEMDLLTAREVALARFCARFFPSAVVAEMALVSGARPTWRATLAKDPSRPTLFLLDCIASPRSALAASISAARSSAMACGPSPASSRLARDMETKPLNGGKSTEVSSQYEKIEQKKADTTKRVAKVTKAVSDYLENWLDELHAIDRDDLFAKKRLELSKKGPPEARQAKVCDNGNVYQGEWVDNFRHGTGSQHGNGYIYEGQWEANVYHGTGVLEMPSGVTYDGQFFNGKRHGAGFENAPNGTRYEGQYINGFKSGQGTFFMADSSSYRGDVSGNKMHGK
ncbi:unnamed protein product, partial [Prorocentrum cordatum]